MKISALVLSAALCGVVAAPAFADPLRTAGHDVAQAGRATGHEVANLGREGGHAVAVTGRHIGHGVHRMVHHRHYHHRHHMAG